MAVYLRDGYRAFSQPKFESGCCEVLVVRVCGFRQNFYVYSNPDQDDCIYDCLLTSMAAVQAEDERASFLFVGDPNGHHQDWLGSTMTNSLGVAAFDFATVSGCDQLVVGTTNACGGILDLLMTDVPDLIRVAVVAPIGNSDHSSLSAVIIIIIIIIKKGQQCKAGREWYTPYQSEDPAPPYQPIHRKKRKGKRVEDYSRDRAA